MARFDGSKPGPGRPKGVPNKLSRARLLDVFDKLETKSPEMFEQAIVAGLRARPPISFQYLQLWAHYREGKPKDTLAIEQAPPLLVVDALTPEEIAEALKKRDGD